MLHIFKTCLITTPLIGGNYQNLRDIMEDEKLVKIFMEYFSD